MASSRGGKREGAGRKKGETALYAEKVRAYIAEQVEKNNADIVYKAIEQARMGDGKARDWLYDQGIGKVPQATELTGKNGKDLPQPILYVLNNNGNTEGSEAQ